MLIVEKFEGTATEIGRAHGRAFCHSIASNLSHFVEHPNDRWSHVEADAKAWFLKLRDRHFQQWPWLYDEMLGISEGANISFDLIQQLNFRIWQYPFYGQSHACSSFVIILSDGTIVAGGSLDDPRWAYGCVRIKPINGYEIITLPVCGTTWGNRGMNSTGLSLGVSSLPLKGFRADINSIWQQDICFRIILQTCASCQDVVEFCQKYPFFANSMVVDKTGSYTALSCTPAELKIHSPGVKCLTNHALEEHMECFRLKGWDGKIESDTSVARLSLLRKWVEQKDHRVALSEVKKFICNRSEEQSSINNSLTAFMMFSIPAQNKIWIADMPVTIEKLQVFNF